MLAVAVRFFKSQVWNLVTIETFYYFNYHFLVWNLSPLLSFRRKHFFPIYVLISSVKTLVKVLSKTLCCTGRSSIAAWGYCVSPSETALLFRLFLTDCFLCKLIFTCFQIIFFFCFNPVTILFIKTNSIAPFSYFWYHISQSVRNFSSFSLLKTEISMIMNFQMLGWGAIFFLTWRKSTRTH